MRKIILLSCLFLFATLSCLKEDDDEEQSMQKPAGKYLSEIRTIKSLSKPEESERLAELEYNKERFLKKIKFYIPETQQLNRYIEFFYDQDGVLNHSETHYSASNVMIDEKFTYENKILVLTEKFTVENFKSTLVAKTNYKVISENNQIDIHTWEKVGDQLVESTDYERNYYNVKGNLFRVHYNLDKGSPFETIDEFEFDTKTNPFSNLDISFYNIGFPFFHPAECLSTNNVISYRNLTYENGSGSENASDTIVYKYEGDCPVESATYEQNSGSEMKLKAKYFFQYIDLK